MTRQLKIQAHKRCGGGDFGTSWWWSKHHFQRDGGHCSFIIMHSKKQYYHWWQKAKVPLMNKTDKIRSQIVTHRGIFHGGNRNRNWASWK